MIVKLDIPSSTAPYEGSSIDDLLIWATENDCSDVYVKVGEAAYVRRYGRQIAIGSSVTPEIWEDWSDEAINSESNAQYVRNKTHDFSYVIGENRYRINVGYSEGANTLVARIINPKPPKFIEDGGSIVYPEDAKVALREAIGGDKGGMVIISAPTGNGKTTTLGCCINGWEGEGKPLSNANVITLEDPIEYIYESKESTRIVQKQLGNDFVSFDMGIRSAMREHPTHILIGELRDVETIKAAVEAGRSGHTLITTFHCKDVASTVSRLIDNFSGSTSNAIDLISNISLIVCQRLVGNEEGNGYDIEVDHLTFTWGLKNAICEAIRVGGNVELAIETYMKENEGVV